MATLERIWKRSGLLITIIGIAMLAFILTDLLGSGNSILAGNASVIGKVNGQTIEVNEFSRRMNEYQKRLTQQAQQNPQQAPPNYTSKQLADGVWNEILREELMNEQYENLGIEVSSKELYERLKTNPGVQSAPVFKDPQTGLFSEALFSQYINNIKDNTAGDPEAGNAYEQWLDFEEGTYTDTKLQKYTAAVQKGLYMPKNMARMEYLMNNESSTAQFVALEYSSIADSTVEVSDGDLKKYYNKNKEDYKTDESRSIEFVRFEIEPSSADHAAVVGDLTALLEDKVSANGDTTLSFGNTEEDSAYAVDYSDLGVVPAFYRKDNIPAPLDSTLLDQEVGYVEGPYLDGDFYRLTKVRSVRTLPDSVRARHILISFAGANNGNSNSERPYQDAQVLADSLLNVVSEDTAQFAQLAKTYSDDPGSGAQGGNLGWFDDRRMVKPFSDFAFQNETGDIKLVFSQFGFHIIEILEQDGNSPAVELLTISRELAASEDTYNTIYSEASDFAASVTSIEEFSAKSQEKGYALRPVTNVQPFDEQLPGLSADRDFVKWIYNEETEIGSIQISNNTSYYVVAILTNIQEEGYSPLEKVEDEVRLEVIKEKKAEQLEKKMSDALSGASDINALASSVGTQAKNQVANLTGAVLSGYGREPKVIGAMSAVEPNSLSEPIRGNSGVFVVMVSQRTPASDLPDYTAEKEKQESFIRPRVGGQLFPSLEDMANIKDRRAVFY